MGAVDIRHIFSNVLVKGVQKITSTFMIFLFFIAQLGDEKSSKCWCLSPIIRGILWGVDTQI